MPVATVDEVLREALTRQPTAIEWIEPAEPEAIKPAAGEGETGVVTH
jgi:hypothetical protein